MGKSPQTLICVILINPHLFSLIQSSLDGIVDREPKLHFTNLGLLDFIIELVVCEDEVSERTCLCMAFFLNIFTLTGIPFG